MRRLAKWFVEGIVSLAIVSAFSILLTTDSDTEAALEKIKVGMSSMEVDEILSDWSPVITVGPNHRSDVLSERNIFRASDTVHEHTVYERSRLWPKYRAIVVEYAGDPVTVHSVTRIPISADSRTLWKRLKAEYHYQRRRLDWWKNRLSAAFGDS
jgi:hypothetical protein